MYKIYKQQKRAFTQIAKKFKDNVINQEMLSSPCHFQSQRSFCDKTKKQYSR